MHKLTKTALLLTCVLATSGFGACGKAVKPPPDCPQLVAPPATLMQSPETEARVRRELFEQPATQTTKSSGSKK